MQRSKSELIAGFGRHRQRLDRTLVVLQGRIERVEDLPRWVGRITCIVVLAGAVVGTVALLIRACVRRLS